MTQDEILPNIKMNLKVMRVPLLAKLALLKDTGGSFQTIDASNPINPIVGPQKTLAPNQTPGHAAAVKTAEGEATAAVKSRAEYEAKGIKSKQALDALVGVDELINNSTGSWGGAAFDMVASVFGSAPEGALNVGKLKVVQANLMLSQPRMEGPQSDRDVNLYRKAAGQIGDSTVPNKIKLGAVETIRSLHRKYATPDAKGGSGGNTGTSTGGTSQTVLSTAEQQELEALRKQFGKTQ